MSTSTPAFNAKKLNEGKFQSQNISNHYQVSNIEIQEACVESVVPSFLLNKRS